MRGDERVQDGMFSYVSLEQRVPEDHPLRAVRQLTDTVLGSLSAELDALYADSGRPSIAPEYILRGLLLQVFYSVRSERLLVEQIDYNLLFRWFVGLGMDDAVWNHAVFSKNRDRLLTSDVAQRFFAEVNKQAKKYMSDEHFTVDGTLIQAWASQKKFSLERRLRRWRRDQLPWPEAEQQDAPVQHRSRCPAVPEELRQGVAAELPGPCAGGEPQRFDRRCDGHSRRWLCRARRCAVDAGGKATRPFAPHHRGRRQSLRQPGFRAHGAGAERDPACDQERQDPQQQPGPQNHAPAGLRRQPEPPLADRKGLCVVEANRPPCDRSSYADWKRWTGCLSSAAPHIT